MLSRTGGEESGLLCKGNYYNSRLTEKDLVSVKINWTILDVQKAKGKGAFIKTKKS